MSVRKKSYAHLLYSPETNHRPPSRGGSLSHRLTVRPSASVGAFTQQGVRRNVRGVGRALPPATHTRMRGAHPVAHGTREADSYQMSRVQYGSLPASSGEPATASRTAGAMNRRRLVGTYPEWWVQRVYAHDSAGSYTEDVARAHGCRQSPYDDCERDRYTTGEGVGKGSQRVRLDSEESLAMRAAPPHHKSPGDVPKWKLAPRYSKESDGALSQGEYVRTRYLRLREVGPHVPAEMAPYPIEGGGASALLGGGERTRTWQEAQLAGRLPPEWRASR